MASACWLSSSSVTTGRPVCSRASARISSASAPRPLNANGEVRGLNAPPRSIEAPASLTACATPRVCSRDSTVHGPAMRQKVSPAPIVRPLMLRTVGCSWESSDDASLYGREIGTTRSTPAMPSRPSSATPCGSPMAPIAVVSSPGMTTTCTPVVLRRASTARTSSAVAWGVMTIITARTTYPRRASRAQARSDRHQGAAQLQAQVPHAELVEPHVVGQLVADGPGHLGAQEVRIVSEVAPQRVAVDDDPVRHVVAGRAVAVVEAVGAAPATAVGDHDRDVVVLDEGAEQVGQLVQRVADELLEVVVVVGVEVEELGLVGLGGGPLAREALGAQDDLLELLLGLGLAVVGHPQSDRDHRAEERGGHRPDHGEGLDGLRRRIGAEALQEHHGREPAAQ